MTDGKNKSIAIKDKIELKRVQSYLKENNYKAYILFQIGLATGYRGQDLIKLTILDIKKAIEKRKFIVLEEKKLNIFKSKNDLDKSIKKDNFERTAFIGDNLIKLLNEFIIGKEDTEFIYSSKKGKGKGIYKQHVRRDTLGKEFKKARENCGYSGTCGTHTPRKTYGYTQYHSHDKDITFVQELFGHSSPTITRRYIGIDEEEREESANYTDDLI